MRRKPRRSGQLPISQAPARGLGEIRQARGAGTAIGDLACVTAASPVPTDPNSTILHNLSGMIGPHFMDDNSPSPSGDAAAAARAATSEARRAELRAAVKRGLEDVEEGRVVDLEQHLDRIEAMLDELEAGRPD